MRSGDPISGQRLGRSLETRVMARGNYKPANLENESAAEETRPRTTDVTFSEAGGAAVAAILHLLRLVSAELVLHHGLDIGRFEAAARKKIDEFTSPTTDAQARDAGLAFAHHLLEQLLVQIRAQAEVKKRLGQGEETQAPASASLPAHSKLLN
jgi:hypothetical protein